MLYPTRNGWLQAVRVRRLRILFFSVGSSEKNASYRFYTDYIQCQLILFALLSAEFPNLLSSQILSTDNNIFVCCIYLSFSWAEDGSRASVSANGPGIWSCFQLCLDRKPLSNNCVDETWLRSGMFYSVTYMLNTTFHCDQLYRALEQWSRSARGWIRN